MSPTSRSTIIHYANIEDEETGEGFVVLKFPRVGGRTGTLTVPRADLTDPAKLRAKLVNLNADLDLSDKELVDVRAAIDAQPQHYARYAAQTGWHPSRRAFVAASRTITLANPRRPLLPPRARTGSTIATRTKKGNLQGWKHEVARRCSWSDLGTLVLCSAFAAPLLRLCGLPSFGLNLYGPSKMGKSTWLLASGSVSGAAHEYDLPNWDATDSAIGELCRFFNDDLLPLNEVGLMSGTAVQKSERIRKMIYQIGEGRERQRHSASLFATSAARSTYITLWVSTAERSFTAYARAANIERDEGELARCAELSVERPGFETSFDVYPPDLPVDRRQAWARWQMQAIRRGCADHHGVAQEAWIHFLLENLDARLGRVGRLCNRFLASIAGLGLSDVYQHGASNFALIFAAGVLAVDAGILEIEPARLLRCVRGQLLASIRHETGADPRPAVEELVKRLGGLHIAPASAPAATIGTHRYDGFVDRKGDLVIYAAGLRQLYEDLPGADREVLSWLDEHQLIVKANKRLAGKASPSRALPWPDGIAVRSIVISGCYQRAFTALRPKLVDRA